MRKISLFIDTQYFRALSLLVAIGSFASGAIAQSASFTAASYPIVGNTHVAADLNRDGRLDLVGSGLNVASVMINNGDGTFRPRVDFPAAGQTQDVAVGDFNSDGNPDIVVSIYTQQISLSLLLGNGDGTFGAPINFPNTSGADSPAVAAVDLNNDTKLDVVLMHSIACFTTPCVAATTITVMLGNGDATFQTSREMLGGELMHAMTVGDFNRDGIKDLAIGGENTRLFILLGLGDGRFNRLPGMTLIPGGDAFSACNDVDIADFNRDTIQDLVVPLGNGNGNVILLGVGDGNFVESARITENTLNAPYNIAVADYNGDGFVDLARAMGFGLNGLMEIANGNGNGTFQPVARYLIPPPDSSRGAIFIIAADFNADTKPDIALLVGGAGTPATYVLLNTSGTATPPPAVTVSSVSLTPSSVTGGSTSSGTVTLSGRVSASTVVRLTSSNAAATVPASVTIPANSSSATFTVSTTQVTAAATATITATLGTSLRSANLTINPAATTTNDTLAIQRAEYDSGGRRLKVEATSTRSTATLQVFVTSTNQLIGTLTNNGGRYRGDFNVASNPQNITIRSNLGGQATRAVTGR